MAGEASGHYFYDLLALRTDPPQEEKHAAQRWALAAVGRRGDWLSKRKEPKAAKKPENRGDSPPSAACRVGRQGLTEPALRRRKRLGARLDTQRANRPDNCPCAIMTRSRANDHRHFE
jgi:hypothetical protein